MGLKENIKRKRLQCGLTLEDVAGHLGISRQTVQKYESGVVSNIPSDKIERIAELLRTTPAYLMGWDGNEEQEKPPAGGGEELLPEQLLAIEKIKKLKSQRSLQLVDAYLDLLDSQDKD